jgi:biopolymer transport protein ExbD/biopolymer transport protein TolR
MKPICRIDVTAFASVLLALLTMFIMIVGDQSRGGTPDLAKVGHPIPMPGVRREDALVVAVLRNGEVFLGSERVAPDELPSKIRECLNRGAERRVYLVVNPLTKYGRVAEALDGVRSAGVEKIAFLADQRKVAPRP